MQWSNPLTLLSLLGLTVFTLTSVMSYEIWRRMKERPELTLEYLLIRGQIRKAIQIFIATNLIFLASSIVTVIATVTRNIVLAQAFRLGSAIMFIGYLIFFAGMERYTKPHKTG